MAPATRSFLITCLGETKPFDSVVLEPGDSSVEQYFADEVTSVLALFPACGAQGEQNAPRLLQYSYACDGGERKTFSLADTTPPLERTLLVPGCTCDCCKARFYAGSRRACSVCEKTMCFYCTHQCQSCGVTSCGCSLLLQHCGRGDAAPPCADCRSIDLVCMGCLRSGKLKANFVVCPTGCVRCLDSVVAHDLTAHPGGRKSTCLDCNKYVWSAADRRRHAALLNARESEARDHSSVVPLNGVTMARARARRTAAAATAADAAAAKLLADEAEGVSKREAARAKALAKDKTRRAKKEADAADAAVAAASAAAATAAEEEREVSQNAGAAERECKAAAAAMTVLENRRAEEAAAMAARAQAAQEKARAVAAAARSAPVVSELREGGRAQQPNSPPPHQSSPPPPPRRRRRPPRVSAARPRPTLWQRFGSRTRTSDGCARRRRAPCAVCARPPPRRRTRPPAACAWTRRGGRCCTRAGT